MDPRTECIKKPSLPTDKTNKYGMSQLNWMIIPRVISFLPLSLLLLFSQTCKFGIEHFKSRTQDVVEGIRDRLQQSDASGAVTIFASFFPLFRLLGPLYALLPGEDSTTPLALATYLCICQAQETGKRHSFGRDAIYEKIVKKLFTQLKSTNLFKMEKLDSSAAGEGGFDDLLQFVYAICMLIYVVSMHRRPNWVHIDVCCASRTIRSRNFTNVNGDRYFLGWRWIGLRSPCSDYAVSAIQGARH